MTFTIALGWWLVPTLITVVAFAFAALLSRDDGSHSDYAAIALAFFYLLFFGAAAIISLIAWLIWALLA